jgi:hypothetical protein
LVVVGEAAGGKGKGKGDAVVLLPDLPVVVPFLGRVVAHHQSVLGELLEEAFR